ncbi:MAG: TIGR03013 family XrtA/PEP-CTERM system glycosyltransferase [Planctomycetota bacterium]|jgi:sugar transferase (PEP-CTERM system associated)
MPSLREQIIPRRKLLLIASETAIFTALLFCGTSLPPLSSKAYLIDIMAMETVRGILSCLTIGILCQACISYNDLYDWKISQNRAELPNRLLHSAGYSLVLLAILVFLLPQLFRFPGLADVNRETWKLILILALCYLAIYAWRAGFHWFFYKWNFGEQVLVLGTGSHAREIADMVHDNPMSGFEVAGLVGNGASRDDCPNHHRVLGTEQQLPTLAREKRAARVVVALEERRGSLPIAELLACRMEGVLVEDREAMFERVAGKMAIESLRPSYLIFGGGFSKPPVAVAIKRTIDVVAAVLSLVLAAPLIGLVAIAIKLTSRGPVTFRQQRVGQDGRLFQITKFRTMRADAEEDTGPVWASPDDPRVTWVGRWLRLTRVDEIPQMFNVLAGHMSFVGPRPERTEFVEELSEKIPFYPLRLTVKPGITGWAQVNMPYAASIADTMEKLRYDLYYIKNLTTSTTSRTLAPCSTSTSSCGPWG